MSNATPTPIITEAPLSEQLEKVHAALTDTRSALLSEATTDGMGYYEDVIADTLERGDAAIASLPAIIRQTANLERQLASGPSVEGLIKSLEELKLMNTNRHSAKRRWYNEMIALIGQHFALQTPEPKEASQRVTREEIPIHTTFVEGGQQAQGVDADALRHALMVLAVDDAPDGSGQRMTAEQRAPFLETVYEAYIRSAQPQPEAGHAPRRELFPDLKDWEAKEWLQNKYPGTWELFVDPLAIYQAFCELAEGRPVRIGGGEAA